MDIYIKGIYYNVPEDKFDEFYKNVTVGEIVTLVNEPENICESEAIAVYYHYKRIGYVDTNELSYVHEIMGNNNKLKVAISSKHIDSNPKLNSICFSLNTVSDSNLICWKDCKYRELNNVLGDVRISTLIEFEISLELIIDDFIECMNIALSHDATSLISEAAMKSIIELSKNYIDNCQNSLSGQCTLSMKPICRRLLIMEERYPNYKKELHELYNSIAKINHLFSHEDFVISIYDKQISAFIQECKRKNGFFEQYRDTYLSSKDDSNIRKLVCNKIQELNNWIADLPEGLGRFFFSDKKQFCMKLRYLKLGYKNLYEVYTHIALLAYLINIKQMCPEVENPELAKSAILVQSITLVQQKVEEYNLTEVTDNHGMVISGGMNQLEKI